MSVPVFEFLQEVVATCAAHKIEVRLLPTEAVHVLETAEPCAGYFDSKALIFAVAIRNSTWVEVVAHEFGHAQQYISDQYLDRSAWELWDRWLDGAEFPKAAVDAAVETILKCELDAEKRAVGMLSRYGLCPDIGRYVASANVDLLRYRFARKHRRFPNLVDADWTTLVPSEFVPLERLRLTKRIEAVIKAAS